MRGNATLHRRNKVIAAMVAVLLSVFTIASSRADGPPLIASTAGVSVTSERLPSVGIDVTVLVRRIKPLRVKAIKRLIPRPSFTGLFRLTPYAPWRYAWGNCTYWVASLTRVGDWGNARDWWYRSPYQHSRIPLVNAIAVFGGSAFGHVGLVTAVAGGSFQITEENWNWQLGHVDQRWVSDGDPSLLGFLYPR